MVKLKNIVSELKDAVRISHPVFQSWASGRDVVSRKHSGAGGITGVLMEQGTKAPTGQCKPLTFPGTT